MLYLFKTMTWCKPIKDLREAQCRTKYLKLCFAFLKNSGLGANVGYVLIISQLGHHAVFKLP